MCGITGFYGLEDKELLKTMTRLLEHRGPDQSGHHADKTASLGHRRLSIIDLSEKGKQPMSNEDGTVWVTYNGEIYNYKELRTMLEEQGHHFASNTDTEVIVHAYEEYGGECVEKFNGCFAFAVYDSTRKELFLARDRLGVKPLYYLLHGGKFFFSSEIKSLLVVPGFKRQVNTQALNWYLSFFANPLTETMFKGIHKLPPGHTLLYNGKKIFCRKYWDIAMDPSHGRNQKQLQQQLRSLLSDAVAKRLMSDVPLGVYLSGGVDSGSVVALMSKYSNTIKTFSVGFDADPTQHEVKRAQSLADYFGTNHHELLVGVDSIRHLPAIVWHQDEPMGDPTSIPTYLLSKEAKKKVTVVLTGEGADEQFAGYEQEKFMILRQKYVQKFPLWMRKAAAFPLRNLPASSLNTFFKYMGSLGQEGKKRAASFLTSNNTADALMSMVSIFSEEEKRHIAGTAASQAIAADNVTAALDKVYFQGRPTRDLLNQLLLFENKVLLAENLLMKVDKNTMAHGIEARVPFLDHRVVEFAATLPQDLKLRGLKDKYLLRQAMKQSLPSRRHKQTKERFFVPIDHWLKNELQPLADDLLSPKEIGHHRHFNAQHVQKLIANYPQSPLYHGRQIWTLLNFQLWHKIFIEQEKVKI